MISRNVTGNIISNVRCLSSASNGVASRVADDVVKYAYGTSVDQSQAIDVLKSGLSAQPDASKGVHSARYRNCFLERVRSIVHHPWMPMQCHSLNKSAISVGYC